MIVDLEGEPERHRKYWGEQVRCGKWHEEIVHLRLKFLRGKEHNDDDEVAKKSQNDKETEYYYGKNIVEIYIDVSWRAEIRHF